MGLSLILVRCSGGWGGSEKMAKIKKRPARFEPWTGRGPNLCFLPEKDLRQSIQEPCGDPEPAVDLCAVGRFRHTRHLFFGEPFVEKSFPNVLIGEWMCVMRMRMTFAVLSEDLNDVQKVMRSNSMM